MEKTHPQTIDNIESGYQLTDFCFENFRFFISNKVTKLKFKTSYSKINK